MIEGLIIRSLSGFYDVDTEHGRKRCRARGKFRISKLNPLVGDRVLIECVGRNEGYLMDILPRSNCFKRPSVANVDQIVIFASGATPVTDPFLVDRIAAIAELKNCEPVICINKVDLNRADELYSIYISAGITAIQTSAITGEGIDKLHNWIKGKINVFTGNSGVGKSSILNALSPTLNLPTGTVSEKLGRGRHTTRHVELYYLEHGTMIIDTPGYSSLDADEIEFAQKSELQSAFREFSPYLGKCRFTDCAHIKESGCAVLAALDAEHICRSRHQSYVRLYVQASSINKWDRNNMN